jgi:predicted double-glycine peptidase
MLIGYIKTIIEKKPKLFKQKTNYSCGNAAVKNVFSLLGMNIPSDYELLKHLKTTPQKGTFKENIVMFFKNKNVDFSSVENLDKDIKKNKIILVQYQDFDYSLKKRQNHFGVIVGNNDKNYFIIDSFIPKIYNKNTVIKKIDKVKFTNSWLYNDGTKIVKKWGISFNA